MSSESTQTTITDHTTRDTRTTTAVAVDIETINLIPDPDFQDPTMWEPFAVAIAYRDPSRVESEVFIKTDRSPCAELTMYEEMVEWIRERKPEEILTYNGSSYDFPILQHRAWHELRECPDRLGVALRLDNLLHELNHRDLMDGVREDRGYRVSLEQELENRGIEFKAPRHDGEVVSGSDMPEWGRTITNYDTEEERRAELITVVREYASSDVEPLFDLLDALTE